MISMGHINMKRVLASNDRTCALKDSGQDPRSFVPTDNLVDFEGCYLYYDTAVDILFGAVRSMERTGCSWPNIKSLSKL